VYLPHSTARVLVYALVVWTCFHLFVVLYEERHLHGEFGDEYDAYCAGVGRWLPHLVRRGSSGGAP